MKDLDPFKYTGPLDPEVDSLVRIMRHAELKEVINGVRNNTYYAVVAPRQTGKSTFLFQLLHELSNTLPGYQGVYLTLEDLIHADRKEFYQSFARKITTYLANQYQFQSPSLRQRYKTVNTNLDLKDFLLELAKAKFSRAQSHENIEFDVSEFTRLKFILLIDEIDGVARDTMIEFVKTVRSIFIERLSVAGFKAFSIILCGAADLASLTYGKTSPFNISKVIYLRDFSFEEISTWLNRIFTYLGVQFNDSFIQKLFEQTQGHPYLTQTLCSRILIRLQTEGRSEVKQDDFKEIDQIIMSGDINLRTSLEKIKSDELLEEMLSLILGGKSIRYTRIHNIIYNLELAGAIRQKDGFCRIRNPIYEKFFEQQVQITKMTS